MYKNELEGKFQPLILAFLKMSFLHGLCEPFSDRK